MSGPPSSCSTATCASTTILRSRGPPAAGGRWWRSSCSTSEILGSDFSRPNRVGFLLESLRSLDGSLRELGARLTVRRGDPMREATPLAQAIGATTVVTSSDVSDYARSRQRRLATECERARVELILSPGVTVHRGDVLAGGGEPFRVFTPYYRRWIEARRRPVHERPRRLNTVASLAHGRLQLGRFRAARARAKEESSGQLRLGD